MRRDQVSGSRVNRSIARRSCLVGRPLPGSRRRPAARRVAARRRLGRRHVLVERPRLHRRRRGAARSRSPSAPAPARRARSSPRRRPSPAWRGASTRVAVEPHMARGGERRRGAARAHDARVPQPLVDALAIVAHASGTDVAPARSTAASSHYRFSLSPASSCALRAASLANGEFGSGSRLARSRGLFSVVAKMRFSPPRSGRRSRRSRRSPRVRRARAARPARTVAGGRDAAAARRARADPPRAARDRADHDAGRAARPAPRRERAHSRRRRPRLAAAGSPRGGRRRRLALRTPRRPCMPARTAPLVRPAARPPDLDELRFGRRGAASAGAARGVR